MNYELAKQLKDAGFPLNIGRWHDQDAQICKKHGDNAPTIDCGDCEIIYKPTLSELIGACGYTFRSLYLHTDNPEKHPKGCWHAKARRPIVGKKFKNQRGHTPEEAVARLWIQLNKK